MATSFPVTLPTNGVRGIHIRPMGVVAVGRSPFTLETQKQRHQGQVWMLDFEYAPLARADAEPIVAALVSLNGQEGTFLFGDRANPTPRGAATGTPLVKGASQTGEDLLTDGWTSGVTGILKSGDWIQLGSGSTSRLHKVLADVTSDGSGNATLTLWPRISPVAVPADNSAIVTSSPKGLFMLTTVGQDWSIDKAARYGINVSAISMP
jgi:hypothetical protein